MASAKKHKFDIREWEPEPCNYGDDPNDDGIPIGIILVLIAAAIVIVYICITGLANYHHPDPLPLSCGVTEENKSESHIYACGKVSCIGYYHDLVCTNGTTIFKWRE